MKLGLSRIVEVGPLLTTEAGKQLRPLIVHYAQFADVVIRALSNALTIEDNFSGKVLTISIRHNTLTVLNTDGRVPSEVRVRRVYSLTYGVESLVWGINNKGETVITIQFTNTPADALDVSLAIEFT